MLEEDNMRLPLSLATVCVLLPGIAFAQNPPANPSSTTPAISSPNATNPNAPVPGANSFTEGQARSRIESNGYSNVSDLKKDENGIWRGRANKAGKSVPVSLDFQGNVVSR